MLYTDSPTGSLLRKKIDEFNSTTTGLIMTMVNINIYLLTVLFLSFNTFKLSRLTFLFGGSKLPSDDILNVEKCLEV